MVPGMTKHAALDRYVAAQRHTREIEAWNYVTATSSIERGRALRRMIGGELKVRFLSSFTRAAGAKPEGALGHALFHERHLSVSEKARRLHLMARCVDDWGRAREANDFGVAAQALQKLVDHIRKEAVRKAEAGNFTNPYEALVDSYTPGLRVAQLEEWARDLSDFLYRNRPVVTENSESWRYENRMRSFLHLMSGQMAQLGGVVQKTVGGADVHKWKLAQAPHPLCMGSYDDVRVGLNFRVGDAVTFILDAAHESGHAAYRQNLGPALRNTMAGHVAGAGMDEAMALLWSEHVARNPAFFASIIENLPEEHILMTLKDTRDEQYGLDVYPLGKPLVQVMTDLARAPERDGLRVNADERRYPLDLILRINLEKRLINEGLPVAELPGLWNEGYRLLTDIKVEDDNKGVLQDIHWFGGQVGRFPSYMFGRLAAAQIFESALYQDPLVRDEFACGRYTALQRWLSEQVYSQGARASAFDLVERISGRPLDASAYKSHIRARYLAAGAFPPGPDRDKRLGLPDPSWKP